MATVSFELAIADEAGKIVDRKRLSRSQLRRYFENYGAAHVVMEACGTAHYWGRWFSERRHAGISTAAALCACLYSAQQDRSGRCNRAP